MRTIRNGDVAARHIDYCLNILGIRVWSDSCQLVARAPGAWVPIGPKAPLPIDLPEDFASLQTVGNSALEVTAWQYAEEHPGTDIRDVLSQRAPFDEALTRHDPVPAADAERGLYEV